MVNRNHATMFFTVAPRPDLDETAAAAAYDRAVAHLAALPEGPAEAAGYRLFWARGGDAGHRDIGAEDHAVVGRHSACDIPLPAASELSLRHLLVAMTTLADGAPALRVLDLHASLPFYTDDGQPRRSIVATGPVVLRLGTYLFGGVPIGPAIPRPLLPDEMPRAVVTHSVRPPPGDAGADPLRTPSELSTIGPDDDSFALAPGPGDDDLLDVDPPPPPTVASAAPAAAAPSTTSAPAASTASTAAGSAAPPAPSPLLSRVTVVPKAAFLTDVAPPLARAAFARLTLLREGHSASIDLPEADLDGGVLIGRSERCTDGGLRRVLDGNVSRVHALLLREGDDVIAFDLCSTQGMYLDGRAVRRHRISRAGGCLSLARTNPVMMCLHPRGDDPGTAPAPPGDRRDPRP